jgi:putative FmdB family regulatory protein
MPVYDFNCTYCGATLENEIRMLSETVKCPNTNCNHVMDRVFPAPKFFTRIVPSYPGSGARKAGYIHKYQNRPATRPQVGYGGSSTTKGRR